MKKFGFTLGEVLIALGLLGIVSALTVPTLYGENQKKVYASSLAVAVSNFETAARSMIQAEDARELLDTKAWRRLPGYTLVNNGFRFQRRTINGGINQNVARRFMGDFGEYLELTDFSPSAAAFYNGRTIRDINRNAVGPNNFAMNNAIVFQSAAGPAYMIRSADPANGVPPRISEADAIANGLSLRERVAAVVIDINGTANPNMFGKDIFYFFLDNDGTLYPFGGRDASFSSLGHTNSTWDNANGNFACTDAVKNSLGAPCTARLISNGYKMDY